MQQERVARGKRKAKAVRLGALALSISAAVVALGLGGGTAGAAGGKAEAVKPPTKSVTQAESLSMLSTPIEVIEKLAKPMPTPTQASKFDDLTQGPSGPEERVEGTLGAAGDLGAPAPAPKSMPSLTELAGLGSSSSDGPSASSAQSGSSSAAAASQNGAWPYSYNSNPNRQVGKLFFDTQPGAGESWSHCTATAVNSENRSLVLTAGHCVFRPDPDGNGIISGNGHWYENFQFCPGYENGCNLGVWRYRNVSTTFTWFGGYGSSHYYDYRDDIGVLLVNPNSSGYIVNALGGHGISFNAASNQYRYSFGYPVSDWRWPEYSYSGEDMIYCPEYSYADSSIPGTMWLSCTMTGGSSGGPWLTNVQSNWLGYVNSVNSHKPYGGKWMQGPYFDGEESYLFNYWRNR
jgi:hypothetical protein